MFLKGRFVTGTNLPIAQTWASAFLLPQSFHFLALSAPVQTPAKPPMQVISPKIKEILKFSYYS